jgi:hypothetical protein
MDLSQFETGYSDCNTDYAWAAWKAALAQPQQQTEPSKWRDMVVVTLVREGINKHKARELADHFAAQPEQEPVAYPFVVRHYIGEKRPSIKGHGFDGLEVGTDREEAERFVAWVNAHIIAPPAAKWDKPAASFNAWWDSYHIDPANPFAEGSAAYWAWAGWKAAQQQAEPVISAWSLREVYFDEDGEPLMHRSPPAAQRPWVGLEIEEVQDSYNSDYQAQTRAVEKLLRERNT